MHQLMSSHTDTQADSGWGWGIVHVGVGTGLIDRKIFSHIYSVWEFAAGYHQFSGTC